MDALFFTAAPLKHSLETPIKKSVCVLDRVHSEKGSDDSPGELSCLFLLTWEPGNSVLISLASELAQERVYRLIFLFRVFVVNDSATSQPQTEGSASSPYRYWANLLS